jgi:parallel beta-helix repeat protein
MISGNNASNNEKGIYLRHSSNNIIFHNNYINNTNNAYDEGYNTWDDGKYGNYWSDFTEKHPDAKPKPLKPWMWDTPYDIPDGNNKDNCPLINQWPKTRIRFDPRVKSSFHPILHWFLERFPLLERLVSLLL